MVTVKSNTSSSFPVSSSPSKRRLDMNVSANSSSFRLVLLALMVLQNSSVVLIGRYTRDSKSPDDSFVVNHLILITELLKFVFSNILEFYATNGHLLGSIKENIIDVPLDALKIIIPSLLYLLQNSLLYVALSNLSAPLFQVTYQSKLLTTAVVSVIMLQRRYSLKQWICLTTLGIGVATVVLGEKKDGDKVETAEDLEKMSQQSISVGLTAVSVACFSSALAGVYFEKVLKKPTNDAKDPGGKQKQPVSLWMRNIQMAFFSVVIAILNQYRLTGDDAEKEFMHGFDGWVWAVALLQAGGGLLVAAVIKYADNVLKGLATGVSVVTSTLCSMVLFGTPLTLQFALGSAVILTSVFFFSNDVPGEKKVIKTTPADVEMQKPLINEEKK